MVAARECEVVAEKCNEFGVKMLKFSEPHGEVLFFSPPTNSSFGEGPRIRDPFERKTSKLTTSSIPNSGQGVVAVRDIANGTTACLYAGFLYRNDEEKSIYMDRYVHNTSLTKDERRWGKKYSIDCGYTGSRLEIPMEQDLPSSHHPTVGQKVNCDFPGRRRNGVFQDYEHPRWGLISQVVAFDDIKAGEEIFVDYGYGPSDFPADHLWYHEAKAKYKREMESEKQQKRREGLIKEKRKEEMRKKKKKKNRDMQ